MGKIHRLFGDDRFNREILERIVAVSLTERRGKPTLKLDLSTGDLQMDWLAREAVFLFVMNGGEKTLEGRYFNICRHGGQPPYYIVVDLINPSTGTKEDSLGDWETLTVVIRAGNVRKHFEVRRTS